MNTNQGQFQKDMYQVPTPPSGESFDNPAVIVAASLSDDEANQQFDAITQQAIQQEVQQKIARGEIRDKFNEITRDLERDASGLHTDTQTTIETRIQNPVAVEILRLNAAQESERVRHLQVLTDRAQNMHPLVRAYTWLTVKEASAILKPSLESIINQESSFGFEVFKRKEKAFDPSQDPDIKKIDYFLHNGEWFHQQTSPVAAKSFTIKYHITPYEIIKSSQFSNEQYKDIYRSEIVSDVEAYNLWIASKKHFELVKAHIYDK